MSFRALMLEKQDGGPLAHIVDLDDAALSAPEALANEVTAGDVLIRVDWSTINYKDGLAITGKGPVVRKWPMVAGIDGAGVVLDSSHPDWRTGDAVVLNPPFFPDGTGRASQEPSIDAARHERHGLGSGAENLGTGGLPNRSVNTD